jgi:resuscitation-promoting factor RpfA
MAQIRKQARIALGVVAAGTVGTAILLGPASAAQASVNWDAVAQCESGGNWSTNTGNGFYGGLQFSRSTWKAYGGGAYASTADNASRSEQIRIAEKVLDGQGLGAWPSCGRKGGSAKQYSVASETKVHHRSTAHKSTAHKWTAHKSTAHKSVRHRTDTHKKATAVTRATGVIYVVRSGDTLATIAGRHAVRGGWQGLYALNKSVVGGNPNLIFPGQRLAV